METALNFAVKKYDYRDYADETKFAEIYYLFSREAVLNNSLEKFVADLPKRGRGAKQNKLSATGAQQSVDESFLAELDEYRARLAAAFKNRNPDLDGDDLTESVARTLDRLVFIRFLEDKLIEPETMIDRFDSWADFVGESGRLNRIYNGIIFRHHSIIDGKNFNPPEETLREICDALSPKDSPYDFNSIPIHILGSIYERFLGKTIEATDERAAVVEKPEVRKAGGVYYTPEYIVRYIVENTVGKLIAGKKPKEIAEMRFADIACGSGSFLIGVLDYLLRYHTEYYNRTKTNRQEGLRAGCVETEDGTLRLSLRQKKEILLNNIYGVDIDAQAVEVAQLSLFLKLLEDETTGSARGFQLEFRETMLPSLDKNIVHGNSLIDHDIDNGLFENKELRKLNPMNYEDKFPEIMRRGGFDAIVGNPPYVRQELLSQTVKSYFQKKYQTYHGTADLYVYFFEKYSTILKPEGEFGIIVANKWLRANYGEALRRWLKKYRIEEISDFGDLPVFQGATTYPAIVRVRKADAGETFSATKIETLDFKNSTLNEYVAANQFNVNLSALDNGGWSLTDEKSQTLLDKLRKSGVPLGKYVDGKIYRGVLTGLNEAFVIDEETKNKLIAVDAKSAELIKPFLLGRDIKRYETPQVQKYLILIPKGWTKLQFAINRAEMMLEIEKEFRKYKNTPEENTVRDGIITSSKNHYIHPDIAAAWFEQNFPALFNHLKPFAESAEKRYDKGEFWWELRACDYYDEFEKPKIIILAIVQRSSYAYDTNKNYSNDKTSIIPTNDLYLLGLINSNVLDFYLHSIASTKQGGFYEYKPMYVSKLPIRAINFADKNEKAAHDKMVSLVEQMLEAKKQLQAARTDRDKDFFQSRCTAIDRQIDSLVYELYGLTEDEINIINAEARTK